MTYLRPSQPCLHLSKPALLLVGSFASMCTIWTLAKPPNSLDSPHPPHPPHPSHVQNLQWYAQCGEQNPYHLHNLQYLPMKNSYTGNASYSSACPPPPPPPQVSNLQYLPMKNSYTGNASYSSACPPPPSKFHLPLPKWANPYHLHNLQYLPMQISYTSNVSCFSALAPSHAQNLQGYAQCSEQIHTIYIIYTCAAPNPSPQNNGPVPFLCSYLEDNK